MSDVPPDRNDFLSTPSAVWRVVASAEGGAELQPETLDSIAVEGPLAIDFDCARVAVTMRTPGHDDELAVGFLHSEGLLRAPDEVHAIRSTPAAKGLDSEVLVNVIPTPVALERLVGEPIIRRGTLMSAACGVCGRDNIRDLLARVDVLPVAARINIRFVLDAVERLQASQPGFQATGGLHAAAICDVDGAHLVVREDIGRHNAVDKAVGALLMDGSLSTGQSLIVSGRASFEIVQKAAVAGIPVVAAVSAVSSLAIAVADAVGVSLVGFVRGTVASVYTHSMRFHVPSEPS